MKNMMCSLVYSYQENKEPRNLGADDFTIDNLRKFSRYGRPVEYLVATSILC